MADQLYDNGRVSARPPPPPPPSLARVPIHGTRVSRTYEPSDPELKEKRVRPLRLKDLEQIPRAHVPMYRALFRAMPEAIFDKSFNRKVSGLLQRHAGMDVDLWLHSLRFVDTNRLRALIPGTTCLLVVGILPHSQKIVVEVDLAFVYRAVASLLGAKATSIDIHRPLTEIEQGVFLFLVLKVLALFQQGWAGAEQVGLRIEDIRGEVRGAADVLRSEKRWLCATWKLTFDLDVGSVRILMPETLVRAVVLERPPPGSALAERVLRLTRRRFGRVSGARLDGWLEVGRIELTRDDLAGLDPGDIVLLDETKIALGPDGPGGPAEMRLGLGRHGVLRGEVRAENGKQVFEVQEIAIEEMPDAHDPIEGHGEHDNPEGVVAAYEERPGGYGDDEADDGGASGRRAADRRVLDLDALDEDWGVDDEDDGDEEEFEGEEEGYAEEGGYAEGEEGEEEPEPPADDNLEEVAPLLGDIPMVLVVELARVQLTADEVIRLRPGQLIELGRSPQDPVDLVVNGRLVAKGELVEIEGSLGVKLVSLVKGAE